MDGVAETSSEKRRRSHIGDKESVDRISPLPDALLSCVLNLLPIDQAVKTCLLSRRWRFVWTSISNLKFKEKDIIPCQLKGKKRKSARWLEKFVDGVLGVGGSSSISEFLLFSSFGYKALRVRSWISTSIARNVEDLTICIGGSRYIRLPPSLYTCQRLKALSLFGPFDFKVPDSVCLTNLKNVSLDEIAFDDHSLNKLLSACALEELLLKRRFECHGWISNICSPSLKSLTILDFLKSPGTSDCTFVIDTPGLKCITLLVDDGWRKNYCLRGSPSLEMADLCTSYSALKPNVFVNLLNSISNVQKLKFSFFKQDLVEGDEFQKLPVFHNLKHLELNIDGASQRYLAYFLNQSPNFAYLRLEEFESLHGGWQEPDQISECLTSHLEEVMISGCEGSRHELQVVGYLLKNGKVLEKMTIQTMSYTNHDQPSDDLEPNVKVAFLKRLLLFPRGSSSCQIAFC